MKIILLMALIASISGCDDRDKFPPIESKAAKICIDAGLVPDSHQKPYRCYIADDDPRLVK